MRLGYVARTGTVASGHLLYVCTCVCMCVCVCVCACVCVPVCVRVRERESRQFSRILADGTRHCFQDDEHLQRDLLLHRTAPRYKRIVTHIVTEENKTKKHSNGILILWSIDGIRTELRDTEEAERSLHNKLHMRPAIGTIRLPNGKTGTANSAFDMSGYTDVHINLFIKML